MALVGAALVGSAGAAAAVIPSVGDGQEYAHGAETVDTGTDGDSSARSDDETLIVVVLVAGVILVLVTMLVRSERSPSPQRSVSAWGGRAGRVCAEGQSTVDLTTVTHEGEPGSGLTLEQLRIVESRSDQLIANLRDLKLTAPSELAQCAVGTATNHACALRDAVQIEREIRLASVSPEGALLDATSLQLTEARVALDDALREVSSTIADPR